MKDLVKKLLDIWYACLIDHHKDRDCHFYIEQRFSYGNKERWSVYHKGYLYKWEYEEDSYNKCLAKLSNKLTHMIKEECECYLDEDSGFTDAQRQAMKDNLKKLGELLDNAEA